MSRQKSPLSPSQLTDESQTYAGIPGSRGPYGERGVSGIGLIVIMASLAIVAVLTLTSLDVFDSGGSSNANSNSPSLFSNNKAEQQLQLCVEGRDSTYGSPPSPAIQAKCVSQLASQAAGGAGSSNSGLP